MQLLWQQHLVKLNRHNKSIILTLNHMYRFVSEDRLYSKFTTTSVETGDIISLEGFDPIQNKLFNFDLFNIVSEEVSICHSPTRRGSIAGVLLLEGKKTFGRHKRKFLYKCVPDDRRLPIFLVPYKIKQNFNKAYKNRYVIINFRHWDEKHPYGYIDQNLGEVTELSSFYQYQLYCRSLNASIQNFTKDTRNKLKKRPEEGLVSEIAEQYAVVDRRHLDNIITIDPSTSKDFDDAIGVQKGENGAIVSIYIANVPLWLDFLGLWDSFSSRIATIYLPDRKLPMMPTILSDILCSLQEGCSRFALCLDVYLDKDYNVVKYALVNTVIKVKRNLRYDTDEMLSNETYTELVSIVDKLNEKIPYLDNIRSCHDIIAYLMITKNHYCAKYMFEHETGIYRTMTYGKTEIPDSVRDKEIQNFLRGWHSSGGMYCKFGNAKEHAALDLEKYLHITSPIRRLVDLLNMIEIQKINNLTNFTIKANNFYQFWTTDLQIKFINETMRSIRKVQNECTLLYLCTTDDSILSKNHRGFAFDKMKRSDGMIQYQVYLPELKMVRKSITHLDLALNSYHNYKLYLFMDQDRLYKKVRIVIE